MKLAVGFILGAAACWLWVEARALGQFWRRVLPRRRAMSARNEPR